MLRQRRKRKQVSSKIRSQGRWHRFFHSIWWPPSSLMHCHIALDMYEDISLVGWTLVRRRLVFSLFQHDRIVLCFCARIRILCPELLELLWSDHGNTAQNLDARYSWNTSKLIKHALKWLEEASWWQHYLNGQGQPTFFAGVRTRTTCVFEAGE